MATLHRANENQLQRSSVVISKNCRCFPVTTVQQLSHDPDLLSHGPAPVNRIVPRPRGSM
jgi:hypothetical protein